MGKYSVRGWQYWPERSEGQYRPPSHAVIYMSHRDLVSGLLPTRIALPSLIIATFSGPSVMIPDSFLLDTFLDFISVDERGVMKATLQHKATFSEDVQANVHAGLAIPSRTGCHEFPTQSNLLKSSCKV